MNKLLSKLVCKLKGHIRKIKTDYQYRAGNYFWRRISFKCDRCGEKESFLRKGFTKNSESLRYFFGQTYPNDSSPHWHVELFNEKMNKWIPLLSSVGNKSFAYGFLSCANSLYPHPEYRMVDPEGEIFGNITIEAKEPTTYGFFDIIEDLYPRD